MAYHWPNPNSEVSDDEELKPDGEAHSGIPSDFIVPARRSQRLKTARKLYDVNDMSCFMLSSSASDMSDEVDDMSMTEIDEMSMTEIDEECHHITDRESPNYSSFERVEISDLTGTTKVLFVYSNILSSESGFFRNQIKELVHKDDKTLKLSGVRTSIFELFVKWCSDPNSTETLPAANYKSWVNTVEAEAKQKLFLKLSNDGVDLYMLSLQIAAPRFRINVINDLWRLWEAAPSGCFPSVRSVKSVYDKTNPESNLRKFFAYRFRRATKDDLEVYGGVKHKDFFKDVLEAILTENAHLRSTIETVSELVPKNKKQKLDEIDSAYSACQFHKPEEVRFIPEMHVKKDDPISDSGTSLPSNV